MDQLLAGVSAPPSSRVHGVATIYDVARLAGVNPSTVSRALNQPGRVSAGTAKRVHQAAGELNYRANQYARALLTGRLYNLGLVVPDITNPSFLDVIRGAGEEARSHQHTLVLGYSGESPDMEHRAVERMIPAVDGIILAGPRLPDEDIRKMAATTHVVLVNRSVDSVPSVSADTEAGVVEAVRHLSGMGHREIAYVGGPEGSWMSLRRWEAIKGRCDWHGMRATLVACQNPTPDGGRRAAAAVRDSGATAVICYNDLMAIGLMRELQAAGICVPGELSIMGFDNIFGSDFTTPPLSTIKSPLHALGAAALDRLLGLVDAGRAAATEAPAASPAYNLATELVLRGSTGAASRLP